YNDNLGQDFHATITVDQVGTCKEMLLSGVGVTILPEVMMKYIDKNQFECEKVLIEGQPLIRSTFMSYEANMLQLPQVDSFVNLMYN
ncbi:LysR substrate-binding domain-containing protein, partial [Staphylococcus hominis]